MKLTDRFLEVEHNRLDDLQGGQENEYYHLNENDYDDIQALLEVYDNGGLEHNWLVGMQGGQEGEYYHLTEQEYQNMQELIEMYDELVALVG